MLLNQICRECGLTKKAVEYYEKQGLICPGILENGYRDFSADDKDRLKKIAVLRKLGMSVPEIKAVVEDPNGRVMAHAEFRKSQEMKYLQKKLELLRELARTQNWLDIQSRLESLEKKQSILERLINIFPGAYGKYVSLHFASFLQDPIETADQEEAFQTIIAFLDNASFAIPEELQEYLEEAMPDLDESAVQKMSQRMEEAVRDTEKYIADNREFLDQYLLARQSEEFQKSPVRKLDGFFQESGYYDVFIPAMKRLSKPYREYQAALEKANKVFMESFPSLADPD